MKIAITGGFGYIGSRLVERLVGQGHEVLILDNLSTSVTRERYGADYRQCDITDADSLARVDARGFDVLMHLAAQSSGAFSFEHPEEDIRINVIGTLNMIDWCRRNGIPRILFASSFTVYGDQPGFEQLSEQMPCKPKAVYALSKHTCENLLRIYAEPHGIAWNALRMFNVYGPGQDLGRADQGMVSIFLGMLREGDYVGVKGSLDRFRDFIYIDDVLNGWECCLGNDNPAFFNRVYNLGSGTRTSVGFLIRSIADAMGKGERAVIEEIGTTPGDILGCYADISAFRRELGYRPEWTLHQGLREMIAWSQSLAA